MDIITIASVLIGIGVGTFYWVGKREQEKINRQVRIAARNLIIHDLQKGAFLPTKHKDGIPR